MIDLKRVRDIELINDRNKKVLAAALMYAEEGFYVIPIRKGEKAIPPKKDNINYAHASRKPHVIKRWFGEGGRYEGCNVGIACGRENGTFVVDLDVSENINGYETFEGIAPEGYQVDGPIQMTPRGGIHMLYRWQEDAVSSVNKLGQGIDTRGGDKLNCKSHIVVWPSEVPAGKYEWQQGGEPPLIPKFISDKLGKSWAGKKKKPGRGSEGVLTEDMEDQLSIEQMSELVFFIDPDELAYDEWLAIGMAIATQHHNDEGLTLWDDWSKQGRRYKGGECYKRWQDFDETGDTRLGTIIFHAKKAGWTGAMVPADEFIDEIDELVNEMNKTFAVVPIGNDIGILQQVNVLPGRERVQPPWRILKKTGFRTLLENKQVATLNANGQPVKKCWSDVWLAHERRREYPAGMDLFPGEPETYQGYFNMWRGFTVEPKQGDWSLFQDHILKIACNGDRPMYEWVLDWMADMYQDPGKPKGCAIVMHGIEGCGKGTFAQMVGSPFGFSFKHLTSVDHLVGNFNAHMENSIPVFADEVTFGGDRKVAGRLKAMVSEEYITSERKGFDAVQVRNCAHLMVASNESWFIPAGPQSRRWCVLEFSGERANDYEYFQRIHDQMEKSGGLEAMVYDLLNRNITSNLRYAPETKALENQRAQYIDREPVVRWWNFMLETEHLTIESADAIMGDEELKADNLWPGTILKAEALKAFQSWCKENNIRYTVAPNQFTKEVGKFGWEPRKGPRSAGRKPMYTIPTHEEAVAIFEKNFGIKIGVNDAD